MHDYLYSAMLYSNDVSDKTIKLSDLISVIRKERDLDKQVIERFPIENFGNGNEDLRVKGSKDLLDAFHKIYAEKMDIIDKLENIEYIGLSDKNEIILNFKNDFSATGIYDFTYEFFEEHFRMGRYANFCIEEGYNDLVRKNLDDLFKELKDEEKQYRLIMKNDNLFIRGLTSTRYKDYDNNLALYLSLLAIHKFAKENDIKYYLSKSFLSDSYMSLVLEQETPVNVPDVGNVYFGAVISNNELGDGAFSFEIRYRIVDATKKISFGAVPDIKDSVFDMNHLTGIDNVESKISRMFKLKELQETMLSYIIELKKVKSLSNNVIYDLIKRITNARNSFKSETRKSIQELYDKNLINNTLTLIEAFNKIDSLVTDIDERVYLERIYHEIIKELSGKKGE